MTHTELQQALSNGLLAFPVTDMDKRDDFASESYARRIDWFLTYDIAALFVAGGTGEFFSLSVDEYTQIVDIATQKTNGKVPVISSVGRSIPEAIHYAHTAEQAGVDALLLMPPYLVNGPQDGVYQYAKAILQHTSLPVIYYNRANGVLSTTYLKKLTDNYPNLIGLKDGTGDIQELNDTIKTMGDRLVYIGGVPTAEIISEAYLSIGVNTYSSAVFNFVPELALHFYRLLRNGEKDKVKQIIQDFYIPLVRLRGRKKGYAVSLIKAATQLIDRDAGPVRPPLVMPTDSEIKELQTIMNAVSTLTT